MYKRLLMDIFFVVADPTRRKMIDMLAEGPLPAGAFVAAFPSVSQPAVSQHLKVLRDSGVVSVTAQQQRRIYALKPEALEAIGNWIAQHVARPAPAPTPVRAARSKPSPKPIAMPADQPAMLDLFG